MALAQRKVAGMLSHNQTLLMLKRALRGSRVLVTDLCMQEVAQALLAVSVVLGQSSMNAGASGTLQSPLSGPALCDGDVRALRETMAQALGSNLRGSSKVAKQAQAAALKDCSILLTIGRPAVLIGLNECRELVCGLLNQYKASNAKSARNSAFRMERKLYFLLVWANAQAAAVWQEMMPACARCSADLDDGVTVQLTANDGKSASLNHAAPSSNLVKPRSKSLIAEL